MALPGNTPIIVGVGEVANKNLDPSHAVEPADLMVQAIRRAIEDASISDKELATADSISVVPPWTWAYPDLPSLLAEKVHAKPSHLAIGYHGGNQPALQYDEAARRISQGKSKLAIVTGGEALASLAACHKAGKVPPEGWSKPNPSVKAIDTNDLSFMGENVGSKHKVGLAIQVYPLYENGLRAYKKQTQQQNLDESAELYAQFDEVACKHPYSWRSGEVPRNASDIGTITKRNRMICTPYPLLMNAFNTVNLAAACVLTSVEHAERLGIPREKWIYVLGGAGTEDDEHFWKRINFHSSPSLEQSIDGALSVSGLKKEEVDCFDVYSCFPIVPKLACKHLGLSVTNPEKPVTLLGGLTSFGGAGNNYSMHAITELTRQLRKKTYRNGLVIANGGVLTHHHALCLSAEPRTDSRNYPKENPLPPHVDNSTAPPTDEKVEGVGKIETYTVEFDRQGRPQAGYIVGRVDATGHRFIANHADALTLNKLAETKAEPIGMSGIVSRSEDGRNLFSFGSGSKL